VPAAVAASGEKREGFDLVWAFGCGRGGAGEVTRKRGWSGVVAPLSVRA
jgi:hypothetical protein